MGEIRVEPGSLGHAAGEIGRIASRARELAAQVSRTSGGAAACGGGEASESYAHMVRVWQTELTKLASTLGILSLATGAAGEAYRAVDESVMPVVGSDR